MNAQLLYATMTGHSKKIAQTVSNQTGIPTYDIKSNPQLPSCDVLFIVSGIYGGESKPELLEFVKKLSPQQIKKVILLTSSTSVKTQGGLKSTLIKAGLKVSEEEFICQGSFLFKAVGRPNKMDLDSAVKFVQDQLRTDA